LQPVEIDLFEEETMAIAELHEQKIISSPVAELCRGLTEAELEYDESRKALWVYMKGEPIPCFTVTLLKELNQLLADVRALNEQSRQIEYVIGASKTPGIYNLGGDLQLFRHCVESCDKQTLRDYAYASLDLGFTCANMLWQDVTTISLLEGNAFGGGLEGAMSCNVVIAEKRARLGFPEILFNMFPGMGAYTYLRQRIHVSTIERLLTSGRNYTPGEFHDMGLIDVLAEDGTGHTAVDDFIDNHSKQRNGRVAIHKAKMIAEPISLQELRDIADLWVDTALKLDPKSLLVMERLFKAQLHRTSKLKQTT
jgi:DSF synthase